MSKQALALVMGLTVGFAIGAYADDTKKADAVSKAAQGPMTTEKLLNKLHTCNATETELAKLAIEKSENETVQEYADMLTRDHRQADQKVRNLASARNITLKAPETELARGPGAESGAAKSEYRKEYERLQSLSGKEFNREYTMWMTKAHQKMLETLENARVEIDDPQVKTLIAELEPTLRNHEQRAATLARQFGAEPIQLDRESTD